MDRCRAHGLGLDPDYSRHRPPRLRLRASAAKRSISGAWTALSTLRAMRISWSADSLVRVKGNEFSWSADSLVGVKSNEHQISWSADSLVRASPPAIMELADKAVRAPYSDAKANQRN